jgi:hypothetical protein
MLKFVTLDVQLIMKDLPEIVAAAIWWLPIGLITMGKMIRAR